MKKFTITAKYSKQEFDLTLEHNKSIQIDCTYMNAHHPKPTSVKFQIGDQAEYDSYNLHYLGTITGITEKTITFEVGTARQPEVKRLKIYEFCDRNFNFNLEKIKKYNTEESYCI
jgi:hypothetical protein